MLKHINMGKLVSPARKRTAVSDLQNVGTLCPSAGLSNCKSAAKLSNLRSLKPRTDEAPLTKRMLELVRQRRTIWLSSQSDAHQRCLGVGFYLWSNDQWQSIKWLTIVDEYTRECLALLPDRSISSQDVLVSWQSCLRCEACPSIFVEIMVGSISRKQFKIVCVL